MIHTVEKKRRCGFFLPIFRSSIEKSTNMWIFESWIPICRGGGSLAAEIKRAHELKKPVCNLPEPGRMVELLLKRLSEQYRIPMEDKTEEQQEAAESEEDNGE